MKSTLRILTISGMLTALAVPEFSPSPAMAAPSPCSSTSPALLVKVTCSTAGTASIDVPVGATYASFKVVGGGASGAASVVTGGATSGSGASISGSIELPATTSTLSVVVGAGGALVANAQSPGTNGGIGGGGSGLFAIDGSSAVLADLVIAGGGGGAGSAVYGASGSLAGGNAGLPGGSAQDGAGDVSLPGASGVNGSAGTGATSAAAGVGGAAGNGTAGGTGGAHVSGAVAAGGTRGTVSYGAGYSPGGGGGGGYYGGGGGGAGVNGGSMVGAAGGGGSSYVHPTHVVSSSASVVSAAGPGYRGNTGRSDSSYPYLTPTAGTAGRVEVTFSISAPPTVTAISPSVGATAGGTSVTITGTGFVNGATVTIGGSAATNVTFVSATQLTATTPAGTAGTKDVVITNPDTLEATGAGLYTYAVAPTVTAVDPASGPSAGGTSVTITGTGFVNGATVTIGGNAATNVTFVSATQLTSTTPAATAGTADIVVTNPSTLTGTGDDLFTFVAAPTVSAVTPASGPLAGATSVTITGTGFVNGATVTIGGNAATNVVVSSSTELTATTPVGNEGTVDVVVTNPDTQTGTGTGLYTYAAAPTVTAVNPATGSTAGGTSVTITGTGFVDGATVTIGGSAATNVVVASATEITATTPAGGIGAANITVTNPDTQSGTGTGLYTYTVESTTTTTVASSSPLGPLKPNSGLAPGASLVTVDGKKVPVTITKVSPAITMTGSGFRMRLVGFDENKTAGQLDARGRLILQAGGFTRVSGDGFAPNSDVKVYLFSTPVLLGVVRTDATGAFTKLLAIPADTKPGDHTIQANGFTTDRKVRSLNLGVVIPASVLATSTLPATGTESTVPLGTALASLLIGAALLAIRRRVIPR